MSTIHSKVKAGGAGGAAGILIVWILTSAGVHVPAEVGAAIATLASSAAGYLKRS